MFLILFNIIYTCGFLLNRTIFLAVKQAFARIHLGFFQVWGKCCSILLNTRWCIGVCIPLDLIWVYMIWIFSFFILWQMLSHMMLFFDYYFDRCYCQGGRFYSHIFGRCYCHYYVRWYYSHFSLYYDVTYWQMLLPKLLNPFWTSIYNGWCYCHCGWCYYHCFADRMCCNGSWCYCYI